MVIVYYKLFTPAGNPAGVNRRNNKEID